MSRAASTTTEVRPDTLLGLGFVALWGTGFVGAKFGLPYADPIDFLAIRFVIVALLFSGLAVALGAPWPDRRRDVVHIAVAGLLLHGVYLSGVFIGIDRGVPAGVMALIVGAQPVLTAIVVGPFLGERVRPLQWLGFLLGFAGLTLVVSERLTLPDGDSLAVLGFGFLALLAITAGTLYQKRYCPQLDLRTGTAIQYVATAVALGALALALESETVEWTPEFLFALGWLSLVLSLGAVTLLYVLLRRGAASKVASLFFLVPPTAAGYAWLLFGETLGPLAFIGMVVIMVGILLVNRAAPRA